MEGERPTESAECGTRRLFELRPTFFKQAPAVDPLELAQLRQAGRHREWISRKRPCLVNRPERRKMIHDFRATAECANRQTAADHFSERRQVWFDAVDFLRAATRHAKTSHHFVENQKRAFTRTKLAQPLEKSFTRKVKARVCRNWL